MSSTWWLWHHFFTADVGQPMPLALFIWTPAISVVVLTHTVTHVPKRVRRLDWFICAAVMLVSKINCMHYKSTNLNLLSLFFFHIFSSVKFFHFFNSGIKWQVCLACLENVWVSRLEKFSPTSKPWCGGVMDRFMGCRQKKVMKLDAGTGLVWTLLARWSINARSFALSSISQSC